jgi:DNA-binding NtrC family response regulator
LTPSAINLIRKYPWPGNVRQLQNAIARAMLLETEEWIDSKHLKLDQDNGSLDIQEELHKNNAVQTSDNKTTQFKIPTKGIALEELERKIINSALKKARGNMSHAARLLKISRGKLRYRLEKLGMDLQ